MKHIMRRSGLFFFFFALPKNTSFNSWVCIYLFNWSEREMAWLKLWLKIVFLFSRNSFRAKGFQCCSEAGWMCRLKFKWNSCGNLYTILWGHHGINQDHTLKTLPTSEKKMKHKIVINYLHFTFFFPGNLNWSDSQEDRLRFQTHRFSFHSFV